MSTTTRTGQKSMPESSSMDPNNPNFPYAPPPSDLRSQRQPIFDTDLRGLFSEEESAGRTFSSQMARLQQFQLPPQQVRSSEFSSREPVDADALTQIQSDQQPVDYTGEAGPFPTPYAPTPSPSFPQAQPAVVQEQQQPQFTMSPWSDLDFLDSVSIPDALNAGSNDPILDPLGLGFTWDGSVPGMDMGNGSGSVDVFDGFFFGGTGMGSGYGGTDLAG
jgi:hypothetical protein